MNLDFNQITSKKIRNITREFLHIKMYINYS